MKFSPSSLKNSVMLMKEFWKTLMKQTNKKHNVLKTVQPKHSFLLPCMIAVSNQATTYRY